MRRPDRHPMTPFGESARFGGRHTLRLMRGMCLSFCLLVPGGCEAAQRSTPGSLAAAATDATDATPASTKPEESHMWMTVGEHRFAITLSDNATARAFAALLPLTLDMSELNGNEKHARLPQALPASANRPGTIRNGDLLLYGTDTLVVFYSTFDSLYAYTRIGRVDDPDGLARALGRRDVRVVFSRHSSSD